MIKILITGVGGGVAQSVIRALRLSRLDVFLIGTDIDPDAAGFYTLDGGYRTKRHDAEGYVDEILEICRREQIVVAIPGLDPEVIKFANHQDQFREIGVLPVVGSREGVRICRNKWETARFFKEKGLPFAETCTMEEALERPREFRYPAFVKPIDGSASRGAGVVFSPEELMDYRQHGGFILQQYLIPAAWGIDQTKLSLGDVFREGRLRQEDELGAVFAVSKTGELFGTLLLTFELHNGVLASASPYYDPEVQRIAETMPGRFWRI